MTAVHQIVAVQVTIVVRPTVPDQVIIVDRPVVPQDQAITVVAHQGALLVAAVQVTAVAVRLVALLVADQAIIAAVRLLQVHAQVIVVVLPVALLQEARGLTAPVVLLRDVLPVEDHTVVAVVEVVADADNTIVS
ncbi:MAG: hypothetical protein BGO84_05050 [Dysgonomonas sp. 37-18]|nr:MAG: hypothetical protein BGO84_05050 [Dysgonomonas sp. 37-18]